jgi:hypothetical protein
MRRRSRTPEPVHGGAPSSSMRDQARRFSRAARTSKPSGASGDVAQQSDVTVAGFALARLGTDA